jgi:hypothetical protein
VTEDRGEIIVTLHYHVGTNIPGHLPEGDVYAVEDWQNALDVWKEELVRQAEWFHSGHLASHDNEEKQADDCESGGEERCEWYELIMQVEADKQGEYEEGSEISITFHTPEGPDMAVWLQKCTETDCVMTWDED